MGSWYLSITISLVLIFIGLTTHWILMLVGVLLLFVPTLAMLIGRRRARSAREGSEPRDPAEPGDTGGDGPARQD